jgi:peptide/nickel transport system substrate-binding protein
MSKPSRILIILILVLTTVGLFRPVAAQADRTVTMGTLVELYTIDPANGFDQAIGSSLKQLYDALFRYVGNPPKVQPWLAESHEVSNDGLTYTVKLRKEAVFHDGSPVNAAAVVYSADRLLTVNGGPAGLFAGVLSKGKTKAVDDQTVQFTLDQPYGPFPDILTWLFIVNPKVVEANKGTDNGVTYLTSHYAGSGP